MSGPTLYAPELASRQPASPLHPLRMREIEHNRLYLSPASNWHFEGAPGRQRPACGPFRSSPDPPTLFDLLARMILVKEMRKSRLALRPKPVTQFGEQRRGHPR